MYTGLELAVIGYVLGFVIHIGFFRFFEKFYKFAENFHLVTPTAWCFLWPLTWLIVCIHYISRFIGFCYAIVNYIVSNQWKFKW